MFCVECMHMYLQQIGNEWAKEMLSDMEKLSQELVEEVLREYLKDFKEGNLKAKGWPVYLSAYKVSKAALNAYTRIVAKTHPNVCVNSVAPGYCKSEITCNTGVLTDEQGAQNLVKWALQQPSQKTSGVLATPAGVLPF